MTYLAVSANTLWAISLGIGLVAALIVAFLLIVLIRAVDDIDRWTSDPVEVVLFDNAVIARASIGPPGRPD